MNRSHIIAIEVNKLSKNFKLPHERHKSLKGQVLNSFKNKSYEVQHALSDISFNIKKGEFFGIVGRNGSGKSTLLKCMAGVYTPTSGSIKINGSLVPFIELGVGFNPELSGRDNVFLNGALLGFNRRQMLAMYDDIVSFAELEKFMDQKLKNYSSGMQVRLAFSIAIQAHGDVLLLDEVLAVGDAAFQQKCYGYFSKLKRENKTVVLVSHDSEALLRFCDRGVLVESGKIISTGQINTVVDQYQSMLIDQEIDKKTRQLPTRPKVKHQKQVEISKVYSNNNQGQTNKFVAGEDIIITVEYKLNSEINVFNASIGIYNGRYEEHADRVIGASTQLDKKQLKPSSNGKLKFSVSKPILRNGHYLVYLVLFGESESVPYDKAWEVLKFEVVGAQTMTSRGVIIANHNWEIE
jgi:ABC-2 type transport system ATP-binding protein